MSHCWTDLVPCTRNCQWPSRMHRLMLQWTKNPHDIRVTKKLTMQDPGCMYCNCRSYMLHTYIKFNCVKKNSKNRRDKHIQSMHMWQSTTNHKQPHSESYFSLSESKLQLHNSGFGLSTNRFPWAWLTWTFSAFRVPTVIITSFSQTLEGGHPCQLMQSFPFWQIHCNSKVIRCIYMT